MPIIDPEITSNLRARWTRHITALAVDVRAAGPVFDALITAYSAPPRRYHTPAHLHHVFAVLDSAGADLTEPERAWMAAWFHDVVYDPTRGDNEAQSARYAKAALAQWGLADALITRTAALIDMTANHAAGGSDHTDALFLDADMAILGASRDSYDRYVADVRAEYAHVDDALWALGRSAFLDGQMARDRIFHTDAMANRFEAQARDNLARERATYPS